MNPPLHLSPLARRRCIRLGVDPRSLRGSGPRGRIMAKDVERLAASPGWGKSRLPVPKLEPDAERRGEYLVFRFSADMAQLAAMSAPIAAQCGRLLGGRYSLFDYIARAVVKSSVSFGPLSAEGRSVHLLLVEERGAVEIGIPDAARKSIYDLAFEARRSAAPPAGFRADAVVCDTGAPDEVIERHLSAAPAVLAAVGGTSPKVGIECGRPVSRLLLPLTLYCRRVAEGDDAPGRVAMELKTLLQNPVVLLLL